MTEQEYQRVKDAVAAALERDSAGRDAVLRSCLQDDSGLLATARAMVAAYDNSPVKDWLATHARAATTDAREPDGSRALPRINGAVAPTPDTQPATWGDFLLLEELGRGGFGVVYRAHERALKREVALKVIDRSAHEAHQERIRLEGQMLARIDHPNIVKVYGIHPHGEQLAIVMEYVRGHTLADVVSSDGVFTARDAALVGATICDALIAVHRGGLLHRDIKASNVMRATDGRIVLMDFGAGRDRYRKHEPDSAIVGTPVYMAPEVLTGSAATPASDVFSLGVLIYFLLTGAYPQAPTAGAAEARPAVVWTVAPLQNVPEALARLVERMLSPDPLDRPRMGTALKKELIRAVPRPAGRAERPSTPLPAAPSPSPTVTWQRLVQWAASGLLLCGTIGVLSTAEYNKVLGRHDGFASESYGMYLLVGLKSLLLPVALSLMMAVAAVLVMFAWRIACGVMPGRTERLRTRVLQVRDTLVARRLLTRSVAEQTICLLGLVAFVAILWTYSALLTAMMTPVNDGPAAVFGVLHSGLLGVKGNFHVSLLFVMFAMLASLVLTRRLPKDDTSTFARFGVLALAALIGLLVSGCWRVLYAREFREVLYGTQRCHVIGEHERELLLHCPGQPPPRNRVVRVDDPQLTTTGKVGSPFDAYPSVPGYVPDPDF